MPFEEAEKFLSNQSKEWSTFIQEIGPCRLKVSDELLPHQSIIKSIFFQQLHPKAASTIYQRFLDLFNDVFPTEQDIIKNKHHLYSPYSDPFNLSVLFNDLLVIKQPYFFFIRNEFL